MAVPKSYIINVSFLGLECAATALPYLEDELYCLVLNILDMSYTSQSNLLVPQSVLLIRKDIFQIRIRIQPCRSFWIRILTYIDKLALDRKTTYQCIYFHNFFVNKILPFHRPKIDSKTKYFGKKFKLCFSE